MPHNKFQQALLSRYRTYSDRQLLRIVNMLDGCTDIHMPIQVFEYFLTDTDIGLRHPVPVDVPFHYDGNREA